MRAKLTSPFMRTPLTTPFMRAPLTSHLPPNAAGNALAGLVATTAGSLLVAPGVGAYCSAASYLAFSTAFYCLRRGLLHRCRDGSSALGAREVLRRHLEYDDAWHASHGSVARGRVTHLAHVTAWLLLFQPLYPVLEVCLFPFDMAAFWFYYPSANGSGLIIDSRALRRSGKRGNAAQCFRLDWHRFGINVGAAYPPPNTGRHPPKVECNLPHIDLPQRGVRHWPWRQHTETLIPLLPLPRSQVGA
jgi:hypothetical protein